MEAIVIRSTSAEEKVVASESSDEEVVSEPETENALPDEPPPDISLDDSAPEPVTILDEAAVEAAPIPLVKSEETQAVPKPDVPVMSHPVPVIPAVMLVCDICKRNIDGMYELDYFHLACKKHYHHKDCKAPQGVCASCYCFVCEQPLLHTDATTVASCRCTGHAKCVASGLLFAGPSFCARCNRTIAIPKRPQFRLWDMFVTPVFSANMLRTSDKSASDYLAEGITALTLYYSDVTIHDLVLAGFTLRNLIDIGVDASMFLKRFFCPAIVFSEMKTGPMNGINESQRMEGRHFLNMYGIGLEDLLEANVGLLSGPPSYTHGQEPGSKPFDASYLAVMELTVEDLRGWRISFDYVVALNSTRLTWEIAFLEFEDQPWLKDFPVSEAFKGHRGFFLAEVLEWPEKDIRSVGLGDELEAPVVEIPQEEVYLSQDPVTLPEPEPELVAATSFAGAPSNKTTKPKAPPGKTPLVSNDNAHSFYGVYQRLQEKKQTKPEPQPVSPTWIPPKPHSAYTHASPRPAVNSLDNRSIHAILQRKQFNH